MDPRFDHGRSHSSENIGGPLRVRCQCLGFRRSRLIFPRCQPFQTPIIRPNSLHLHFIQVLVSHHCMTISHELEPLFSNTMTRTMTTMRKLSWEETIVNNHIKNIHKISLCYPGIPHNHNTSSNTRKTLTFTERLPHLVQKLLSRPRVEEPLMDIWSTTALCLLSSCETSRTLSRQLEMSLHI